MTYIATFFTHFAAVNFSRQLREAGQKPMLMPVPRKLSSSCGTCVKFPNMPQSVREDFQLIDSTLIRSALSSIPDVF